MAKFNPYARQIKFIKAVNRVVSAQPGCLNIYRTIDRTVKTCPVQLMTIHLETGDIDVLYSTSADYHNDVHEKATELDLRLLDQQARKLAEQALASA